MVFHVDGVSGVPVVCSEGGLFHLGSVGEFDVLFEGYYFYEEGCHSDYIREYMKYGYGSVDPEDYRGVSFEEFCVSGLWVDCVSAPAVDEVDGAVVEDSEIDDWDDFDVPW